MRALLVHYCKISDLAAAVLAMLQLALLIGHFNAHSDAWGLSDLPVVAGEHALQEEFD